MTTDQIAVRLSVELLHRLDQLVSEGRYASRAAAVRAGVEFLADLERRRDIDRAIVEGYRRVPPTEGEDTYALASLREAIAEEPW